MRLPSCILIYALELTHCVDFSRRTVRTNQSLIIFFQILAIVHHKLNRPLAWEGRPPFPRSYPLPEGTISECSSLRELYYRPHRVS
ncbi:hypothetical protein F5Y12DRAFT_744052 [Xylaria sp. FL1777]|nr:hypothetical protein F5Y12DRAFT_744052 [Xylaria sp. FL1777]